MHFRPTEYSQSHDQPIAVTPVREDTQVLKRDFLEALMYAACVGDIGKVKVLLKEASLRLGLTEGAVAEMRDANGWQAAHEAVRGGHLQVFKYLTAAVTTDGEAAVSDWDVSTFLEVARNYHPSESPILNYLQSMTTS